MKVALVHDWLIHMRGGEKVLEALAQMYPDATIYTLFYNRSRLSPYLKERTIKASFLQYIPGIRRFYRWLLPILPWAISTLRIDPEVRLVISSSHCVAKGIRIPEGAFHICYCHTPMRYVWGFSEEYFGKVPVVLRPILNFLLRRLREWDRKTSGEIRPDSACRQGVHQFVANSYHVRDRIGQYYRRQAEVIYPPLAKKFYHAVGEPEDYYLVVSALVPYKRVDVVIEAFNGLDRKLLIVGSGPCEKACRKLRTSSNIFFLGPLPPSELRKIYSGARALIFPTEEDFGIVPLEAQACGTPVIAYAKGGALESVKSGTFFDQQTPEAIRNAVREYEKLSFDRERTAMAVEGFDERVFNDQMRKLIQTCLAMTKSEHVAC
ncbi:MAG: glycosyltransferase [Candidatus Omnitrophica bacterium]|nr:glycosyltransferase [Candidatus Omnitrophota bacterium]